MFGIIIPFASFSKALERAMTLFCKTVFGMDTRKNENTRNPHCVDSLFTIMEILEACHFYNRRTRKITQHDFAHIRTACCGFTVSVLAARHERPKLTVDLQRIPQSARGQGRLRGAKSSYRWYSCSALLTLLGSWTRSNMWPRRPVQLLLYYVLSAKKPHQHSQKFQLSLPLVSWVLHWRCLCDANGCPATCNKFIGDKLCERFCE